jgi:hypothetical protein
VRDWSCVEIEIDIAAPANADFHCANCNRWWWDLGIRQDVACDPIGYVNVPRDAQHLDLGLAVRRWITPFTAGIGNRCAENGWQIAGECGEASALLEEYKDQNRAIFSRWTSLTQGSPK